MDGDNASSDEQKNSVPGQDSSFIERFVDGSSAGVLIEGSFPLGEGLNDQDDYANMETFLKTIGFDPSVYLGNDLSNLKCVETSYQNEGQSACFKFFLDSTESIEYFRNAHSCEFFGKFTYCSCIEQVQSAMPSEPLNVLWNFSATISHFGESAGNLKKPFLSPVEEAKPTTFLYNVAFKIGSEHVSGDSACLSFNDACESITRKTCAQIGCDPHEVLVYIGRPNVPHQIDEETGKPKKPLVNKFNVQTFLTTMGVFVASVHSNKRFDDVRQVRRRIFDRGSELMKCCISSTKSNVVMNGLELALEALKEDEWKEFQIRGFYTKLEASMIKDVILKNTNLESDFTITKPTGGRFRGETVVITAPALVSQAMYKDEGILVALHEAGFDSVPLVKNDGSMKTYVSKQFEAALLQLRQLASASGRGGNPRPSPQQSVVKEAEERLGVPRSIWTQKQIEEEGISSGPTPAESAQLKKDGDEKKRKKKKRKNRPSENDDPGVEEKKDTSPPQKAWGNSSKENQTTSSSPGIDLNLDQLMAKVERKIEEQIAKNLDSLIERLVTTITSTVVAQLEPLLKSSMVPPSPPHPNQFAQPVFPPMMNSPMGNPTLMTPPVFTPPVMNQPMNQTMSPMSHPTLTSTGDSSPNPLPGLPPTYKSFKPSQSQRSTGPESEDK